MLGLGLDLSLKPSRAGGAPFNPADLFPASGGWWDPSDLSTVWQDTGATTPATVNGNVGRINDKSGNANHLLTPLNPPILRQSGQLYYLEFDGVDDLMQDATISISQPIDRLSALYFATWSANRYVFDGGLSDELILRQNGVTPELAIYAGLAGANTPAALSAAHVVSERYNGASSSLTVDSTTTNASTGSQGCTGLTVGGRAAGAPFAPFRLYGLILRGGTMTAGQLSGARAYLAAKAGL
jgi:hypothetical protein